MDFDNTCWRGEWEAKRGLSNYAQKMLHARKIPNTTRGILNDGEACKQSELRDGESGWVYSSKLVFSI